jgi:hypothetical protein
MEQAISIAMVLFGGVYMAVVEPAARRRSLTYIAIGLSLVTTQLLLNGLFGGDSRGNPVALRDVLMLKEISFNHGFAALGYTVMLAGVIGLVRALGANEKVEK